MASKKLCVCSCKHVTAPYSCKVLLFALQKKQHSWPVQLDPAAHAQARLQHIINKSSQAMHGWQKHQENFLCMIFSCFQSCCYWLPHPCTLSMGLQGKHLQALSSTFTCQSFWATCLEDKLFAASRTFKKGNCSSKNNGDWAKLPACLVDLNHIRIFDHVVHHLSSGREQQTCIQRA